MDFQVGEWKEVGNLWPPSSFKWGEISSEQFLLFLNFSFGKFSHENLPSFLIFWFVDRTIKRDSRCSWHFFSALILFLFFCLAKWNSELEMSNFSSASPLLLFKSKSFRRHRDTSDSPTRTLGLPDGVEDGGGAGASGGGPDSSLSSGNNSPHRLRRVFTTHACRRRPTEAKSLIGGPPGHASPIQFRRMTSLMKKPLGIAHSVPLGVPNLCGPLNFNRLDAPCLKKFTSSNLTPKMFAKFSNFIWNFPPIYFRILEFENLKLPFFALVFNRSIFFILSYPFRVKYVTSYKRCKVKEEIGSIDEIFSVCRPCIGEWEKFSIKELVGPIIL